MKKVFKRLKITADMDVSYFWESWNDLKRFINKDFKIWDKVYSDIEKGKVIDNNYFKEFDKKVDDCSKYLSRPDRKVNIKPYEFVELKKKYDQVKKGYIKDFETFREIKVGQSQDDAIKNISKILQKSDRFDHLSEQDIKYQIDKFNGVVKVPGYIDLYLRFKDGKLVKKEF